MSDALHAGDLAALKALFGAEPHTGRRAQSLRLLAGALYTQASLSSDEYHYLSPSILYH